MSSYWDYLSSALRTPLTTGPAAPIWAAFNQLYDNSHGSDRYWLSKVPILGWGRKWSDEAQQAQDQYNNTGTDPAYIDRINGGGSIGPLGGIGLGTGAVKMARSLAGVYTAEVIEDVGNRRMPQNPRMGIM